MSEKSWDGIVLQQANVLLVFEEARSKKKIKVSSLLHVYLKYFVEQTSYRFVYFYDNTTLHNMLLLK